MKPKLAEVAETSGKIFVLVAALNGVFLLMYMISGVPAPDGPVSMLVQPTIAILTGVGVLLLVGVAAYEFFRNRNQIIPNA